MQTTTFQGRDGANHADYAAAHEIAEGRLPAFFGLAQHTGGVYAEDQDGVRVDTALKAAGLDWRTEVVEGVNVPVVTHSGVSTVNFPRHRATVRVNPNGSASDLGIVKTKYRAVQNIEAGEYGQAIVDEFGANVVAVGAFGEPVGARTYMALRLPETLLVGGVDRHDLFLTVLNDHTGGGGLTALLAVIRLDCVNQTYATFRNTPMRMTIRHSGDMRGKAIEARRALDLTHRWVPLFREASDRMLDTLVTEGEFEAIMKDVLPEPTGTTVRSLNGYADKQAGLRAALVSPTNAFGAGTAYAAYNAFTEWADFGAPVNNDGKVPTARYERIMAGGMDILKDRAFDRVMALVERKHASG